MESFHHQEKQSIILAIDVGKNSLQQDLDGKTYFEKSILCASMILKRKILNGSEDHLALVLFGSSHTINHLSSQEPCYDNIEIVSGLDVASWDLVKRVNNLSPTDITPSDWISTFVLAADVLKNKNEYNIFSNHQIIMFSNLATDISLGNVDIIASCLRTENIRITIIGNSCEVIPLNPALHVFIRETKATAVNFKLVIPKLSYYNQKEVIAKVWDAPLSYGKVFIIKVFGYKQIDVTKISSEWLFNKNYDTQNSTTKNNFDEENKQMEVDCDKLLLDALKGKPKSFIDPTSDEYKLKRSPRCLQVLGFTKTTNTQRSFLMEGGSFIFKPHKRDVMTFNAIFHYMVEREEVIIVRKIDLYINLMNIGVLFPQKEDNEIFFVYVNLPYVQEEHLYQLPSIAEVIQLINENDDIPKNRFVIPEIEYDPQLQSLYDCIVQKLIPEPIPKTIMENTIPTLKEYTQTSSSQQEVSENCPIEDNIVEMKDETILIEDNNSIELIGDEGLDVSKECVITALNPIEDFNKLLENGFDSTIVCKKMQNTTLNLIQKSTSLGDLLKPISTLKVLRKYYIGNNDVNSYNNFMYLVKDAVMIPGVENLWSKFIGSGIGLITNQELEASDISQESSIEFSQLSEGDDNDLIIADDNLLKKCL